MQNQKINTQKLVLLGLFTAIVIVLQLLGNFIRFGPFSVSLVLMPVVIGAALIGVPAGAWLGLVFGIVVLAAGDAAAFLAINPAGAVAVVLLKGTLAGLAAGAVYKALSGVNRTIGAFASAVVCPLVNTGIFILGSYVFFLDTFTQWGMAAGFVNATAYIFTAVVGLNFLFELGLNIAACPALVRLVQHSLSGEKRGQKDICKPK